MTSDDTSATPGSAEPDRADPSPAAAGLASGSDAGSPGERSTIAPEPGDGAVRESLRQDVPGEELVAAEDDPAMVGAVEDDGPSASLADGGDAGPDAPRFREPTAR